MRVISIQLISWDFQMIKFSLSLASASVLLVLTSMVPAHAAVDADAAQALAKETSDSETSMSSVPPA